jgi:hypothetical protein
LLFPDQFFYSSKWSTQPYFSSENFSGINLKFAKRQDTKEGTRCKNQDTGNKA